jgi:MoaA/NifB/PqqE/SkfB family radical SAM enzyme
METIIHRVESWGKILYDIENARFQYQTNADTDQQPYVELPLVLNCYLSYNCNLKCIHCVAEDLYRYNKNKLELSNSLINAINKSPFMLIVITGGEPLLTENEEILIRLINSVKNKGIIIDTNGTILPSKKILNLCIQKNILIRISMDSCRFQEEIILRRINNHVESNKKMYDKKIENIILLKQNKINIAVQTVLYKKNLGSLDQIRTFLIANNIKLWFIQRLIPTQKLILSTQNVNNEKLSLEIDSYEKIVKNLELSCLKNNIRLFSKMDKRHNCVFLMVNSGVIFTSSEEGNKRIKIGKIGSVKKYFEFVSSADHSSRYYSTKDKLL